MAGRWTSQEAISVELACVAAFFFSWYNSPIQGEGTPMDGKGVASSGKIVCTQ